MARYKQQLVRLWRRPTRDGSSYTWYLRYADLDGKRLCVSLGHGNERKAERERTQKENELRMGYCPKQSVRLIDFMENSLLRTGDQISPSTREEYRAVVKDFASVIGNIDIEDVTIGHGEYYRQACLDRGNSKATVAKKLRHLKRIFQLAANRKQLEDNPFAHIDMPRTPRKKVRIYSEDECHRMLLSAKEFTSEGEGDAILRWDLLILTALDTGMRRGELLNLVWSDVDFAKEEINVTSKQSTDETWEWNIKDADERTVPLKPYTVRLLAKLHEQRPVGCPYVFVPIARYARIQERRAAGKWTYADSRLQVVNNFYRQFEHILAGAAITRKGKFHDLRSTAISNWFALGLREYEVMTLAGHSNFETTRKFYLAIRDDYLAKAKKANSLEFGRILDAD